jgi:hypothetical protein
VENVVSPPQNPVTMSNRHSGDAYEGSTSTSGGEPMPIYETSAKTGSRAIPGSLFGAGTRKKLAVAVTSAAARSEWGLAKFGPNWPFWVKSPTDGELPHRTP